MGNSDRETADRAASAQAGTGAAADRATTDRATTDRAAADRATTDRAASDLGAADRAAADRAADRAAAIMAAWERERPDLDPSSIGIVTRVWHLARVFGPERRRLLAELGIEPSLMDLLGTLRRSGPPYALTTRELAVRAAVTPAAISQRLTRAELKGWVAREPAGGRSVLVRLTEPGIAIADATAGAIFAHDDALLATMPAHRRAALAELLRGLCVDLAGDVPLTHVGIEGDDTAG
jgi:DNA-binding MarR family transcriptional regulator